MSAFLTKQKIQILESLDWSLSGHNSAGHITSLHPYPARFIPAIPKNLIHNTQYNTQTDRPLKILDPFAGCGTTLVEGLQAGHKVFGIDINGLAHLLQKVYTYPYSHSDLFKFLELESIVAASVRKGNANLLFNKSLPNVDHWFSKETQQVLSASIDAIEASVFSSHVKELASFALSRIIVKISNQKSDTQYAAVRKKIGKEELVSIVRNSFKIVFDKFKDRPSEWKGRSKIIMGDAREILTYENIKDIDIVITSPPYPNAYEYWLYHKYRMYWLGMDPIWSRSKEIGARPHYSGSGKLTEWDFQKDIIKVLRCIYNVTKKNAVQYWVVGDSVIKGKVIDNVSIISEACVNSGWKIIKILHRELNRSRSSFQGIGRQKHESILVIKKQ